MSTKPSRRIAGLETEYGCMVKPGATRALMQVRDWLFEDHRRGLIDLHDRGWDEPPGNGGFLFNGGRVYIDMGHMEYCTPECASAQDVVRYDRAGDRLLLEAVHALQLEGEVSFIRNNIDHHTHATFGCHENYSLLRAAPMTRENIQSLMLFLTLRVLFTGSGRVGQKADAGGLRPSPVPDFQLSQRADYIETEMYEWVQHNRAILNTRDEPLADYRRYRRLHLLHGDTNVLPSALYLKVGATRLVLDLLEADDLPKAALADAVGALRALSRQLAPPWRVRLEDAGEADVLELLADFRTRAATRFGGRDAETDAVLALWRRVEAALAVDPLSLFGILDWVTKRQLLDRFREAEGLGWNDPWLEAQDLEYHQIDPARSLGLPLADLDGPWALGLDDPTALGTPPQNTRAAVRGKLMHRIAESGEPYEIDWHGVDFAAAEPVLLLDPFQAQLHG